LDFNAWHVQLFASTYKSSLRANCEHNTGFRFLYQPSVDAPKSTLVNEGEGTRASKCKYRITNYHPENPKNETKA